MPLQLARRVAITVLVCILGASAMSHAAEPATAPAAGTHQNKLPDGPAAIRAVGLSFRPPDAEEWRMAMIDIPVFIVKDPMGFY